MAKRELSSTLKNLKFMQRATQREEKVSKEEKEAVPDGSFPSSGAPRKCVVIMEGDPHPGTAKGRMSFLCFNPSIDKLNEERISHKAEPSPTCSGRQSEMDGEEISGPDGSIDANGDLKRKQADEGSEAPYPHKSRKDIHDDKSSTSNSRSSQKQSKREKLDWNLLRPPKSQNRRQ